MRLLLVEDDSLLGDGLKAGLEQLGYVAEWVRDGDAALALLAMPATEPFVAVVLDLGLPKRDGLSVLRALRARGDTTPVLVLTARDTVPDRVSGLDAGADDYLVKPFDLDEVGARLRALIRRATGRANPVIQHGDLVLDPAAHQVTVGGSPVDLSSREYALLEHMLNNQGRVLTRQQLESQLYALDRSVESNAIEVHIHHLRKKCGSQLIRTLRGVGYMIDKDA
jgi:DNA-binding response OmpR family regulator